MALVKYKLDIQINLYTLPD